MKRLIVMLLAVVFFVSCSGPAGQDETTDLEIKGIKNISMQAFSGQYVCCDLGMNGQLIANRDSAGLWETFRLHEMATGEIAFQAVNNKFVTYDPDNDLLIANSDSIIDRAVFLMIPIKDDQYCFKAYNGKYVCGDLSIERKLVANRNEAKDWETFIVKEIK